MGTAQNKLGELFVDIGVGGLGKTLKGLNSVSASFLMTKNAASQIAKPIMDMTHKFGQSAIATKKLQLNFKNLSVDMTQRLQYLAKTQHFDSLFNSMEKLQDMYTNIAAGHPADPKMIQGLERLGISISDYTSDFSSLLQMMQDIKTSALSKDWDFVTGLFSNELKGLDLGEIRWADYLNTNFTNIPAMANALNEQQVKNAIEGEIKLQQLQEKVFYAMQNIFVDHEAQIINMIDKLGKFADESPKFIRENMNTIKNVLQTLLIAYVGNMLGGRAGAVMALGGWQMGKQIVKGKIPMSVSPYGTSATGQIDLSPEVLKQTFENNHSGGLFRNPFAQQNIVVNQNIQSTDPYVAGNQSAKNIEKVLNNNRIERNP